ncbi:hypothetical protein [Polynucleobacter sp. AM-25C3]|uniref:hypothetical protein n=1 Tax=Polynucleobacter sp. AM-25C3 TaxID=1855569 RepID=UPI001C0E38F1|nr:hypothetical protein [Polynucleobacter sp. AM-25C3]MBU3602593.1 hypothetical protein [Polynucleobacter sp. AM-25C3]
MEYIQSSAAKFNAKGQYILVAPSRIEPGQESEIGFTGLSFLPTCFVTPPIYRIPDINKHLHISYFFQSQDQAIADNFSDFGIFVYDKLMEKMVSPLMARSNSLDVPVRNLGQALHTPPQNVFAQARLLQFCIKANKLPRRVKKNPSWISFPLSCAESKFNKGVLHLFISPRGNTLIGLNMTKSPH